MTDPQPADVALAVPAMPAHTGATAAAQHAMAQIQARHLVAISRPRDVMQFRDRLLADCERPGFADKAHYDVPNRGKGMSIRFAEAALRHFGNLYCEAITVDNNEEEVTVRVTVTDLETNSADSRDVTIAKTVERKAKPALESDILDVRVNSYGETVYLRRATDEEILGKRNSLVQKAKRVLIIAFLPFDIVEEAAAACAATRRNRDAEDPGAAIKRLCDAFSVQQRITPDELGRYMGKNVQRLSPDDIDHLRGIFAALQSGDTTWEACMEAKHPTQTTGEPEAGPMPEDDGGE